MTEGVVRGRRLRRRLAGLDVVHFPLTVMIPRVTHAARGHDGSRPPARVSAAVLLARRARLPACRLRLVDPEEPFVVTISEHAARAVVERYDVPESRVRPIHLGLDHARLPPGRRAARSGSSSIRHGRGRTRTTQRLFAAFAELRRSHPDLELVLTAYDGETPAGVRSLAMFPVTSSCACTGPPPASCSRACSRASGNLRSRRWPAGAPSRARTPRRCRRCAATVHDSSTRPRSRPWSMRSRTSSRVRTSGVRRGLTRAALFSWEQTARAHDAVYAAAAA